MVLTKIQNSSKCSTSWTFLVLVNISFVLVTRAKLANHNDSHLMYYNNSENFISCSFNPLCYCKHDQRTEIYETVVKLWFMTRFNQTEYQSAIIKLMSGMSEDPNTIYHYNPEEVLRIANTLANSTNQNILRQGLFEYGPVFDIDCDKVPITQIPTEYNVHGVISHVSVAGSNLIILDGSALAGLEVQGIRLTNNYLYFISEHAFSSMSNSLTMLDLSGNKLDEIPFAAFKNLQILEWLNLGNNLITSIFGDWFGVASTMRKLVLSENSFDSIPAKLLSKFHRLSWLDLSSNCITNLSLASLPPNIQTLNLMKNRISHFPTHLFKLKSLSWLHLSGCDIDKVPAEWPQGAPQLQMNQIDISDNFIQIWPSRPFGSQLTVLDLSVTKNYIEIIPSSAFLSMNVFRLSLGHNQIHKIDHNAFLSLEPTLKYLNLENNRLDSIPWTSLGNLTALIHLYLGSNLIQNHGVVLPEGNECKLTYLGLNGNQLSRIPKRILTHCSHLFHLNLGYNQIAHLDDLAHLLFRGQRLRNLHTLILRNNPLQTLSFMNYKEQQVLSLASQNISKSTTAIPTSNADLMMESFSSTEETDFFKTSLITSMNKKTISNIFTSELFPNLRELSLSFCELSGDLEPFPALPLTTLEISMGLKTTTHLSPNHFAGLRQLEWLALDHNNIQTISAYTFYSNPKLNYVNLEWNGLESLPAQLFHPDIHHSIAQLRLSHNKITTIHSHSFVSFSAINLDLSYNLINTIQQQAFTQFTPNQHLLQPDYQHLKQGMQARKLALDADLLSSTLREYDSAGGLNLYLAHNHLTQLKTHVFTSSKFLLIDLSHNQLNSFTFDSIGPTTAVGTLNLSSNIIQHVSLPQNSIQWLKTIDLSHNKLRTVDLSTLCITEHLDLSHNRLEAINQTHFPYNCSVKELNLGNNFIASLDPGSFSNLRDLTVLQLCQNELSLLPPVAFIRNSKLRFLDLSYNRLRTLPRDSLVGSSVETLNLAWNRFVNIPVSALSQISRHLKKLDLSQNSIEHLDSTMFDSISSLLHLNLSSNRLNSLPDSAFANLASLRELDLSHNHLRANFKVLKLSDCGIKAFPFLPLPHLISLDLSSNGLHEIKMQSMGSLDKLRELYLSNNKLTNSKLPSWTSLYNLKTLKLSNNPLRSLTHDTLYGLTKLEELELLEMENLERFDSDVFSHFNSLRILSVETYPNIEKYRFRLGAVLSTLIHLEELNVMVKEVHLSDQLNGGILPKLRKLKISGENLKRIEPMALEGLQNCFQMDLSITHTNISEIPQRIFTLVQDAVLAKVDLSFNKLTTLDSSALYENKSTWYSKGTKVLEGGLTLDGNEFMCDCDLVWLGEWLRRWLRESFQSHSIDNIPLLHSMYETLKRPKCTDYKGQITSIVELYSDTMCHASALSCGTRYQPSHYITITVISSVLLMSA